MLLAAKPSATSPGRIVTRRGGGAAVGKKTLMDFPRSQGADTLSMKKALEEAQRKMESPAGSSN